MRSSCASLACRAAISRRRRCTPGTPGEDVAARDVAVAAVEVGDDAARFFDQQRAGGDVPWREAELEEAVEDAGGGVGEVESGGAAAADAPRLEEDVAEDVEVGVERAVRPERKAGGEERAVEPGPVVQVERRAVALRAAAARGGEEIVAQRIEHHRGDRSARARGRRSRRRRSARRAGSWRCRRADR